MRAPYLAFGLALSLAALLVPAVAADGHVTKPPRKAEKVKRAPLHKRPNIVFVMTDDQTLENLRVMHDTKRLLADQGATFNQYVVSYSLCCPSRATMLTRPVRAQPPRARQPLAERRLLPLPLRRTRCRSGSRTPATTRRTSAST